MKISKLSLAAAIAFSIAFTSCKPKDADIQASVQSKEIPGITVTVNDGVATLTGKVADEAAKANAEIIAKEQKGVKSVMNEITVDMPIVTGPVNVTPDDPLAMSVRDAVKDHPTVVASVNDGVITLTGSLKKDKLQKLMMNLNSMHPKKIDNKLTVN